MMRTFCQAMSGRAGSDRIHSLAHPMLESTASRSRPPSSFWLSARDRATTPSEAVASIRSRTNVFIHGAAATPTPLIEAMAARRDLLDVRLYRSEEHTSELQSLRHLVCRLLLEKKKKRREE